MVILRRNFQVSSQQEKIPAQADAYQIEWIGNPPYICVWLVAGKKTGLVKHPVRINFEGLSIYIILLAGHILISPTVFEIQGFKNLKKNKNKKQQILGKYCPTMLSR